MQAPNQSSHAINVQKMRTLTPIAADISRRPTFLWLVPFCVFFVAIVTSTAHPAEADTRFVVSTDYKSLQRAVAEHVEILDALEARDGSRARSQMEAHITYWQMYFVEKFHEDADQS